VLFRGANEDPRRRSNLSSASGPPPNEMGTNESLELAALRLALDAARMGWFEHDFQRDRMTFSEALTAIFGFDADSCGGTLDGFFSRLHPDDRDSCIGKIAEARYGGGRFTWEARVVLPDGAERWIYVAGQGSVEENGEASRIVGVAHDVTDRKRMEEA